jgi:hypothetical protein
VNQPGAPTPALRALHEKMADLAVDEHVFRAISLMPDIPVHLLHAACDPASTVLLAWPIYHGVALACTGTEHAADRILPLYAAAKAAREAAGTTGVEDGSAQPAPSAGALQADFDQPTVPKLRLSSWQSTSRVASRPTLQQIRTKRDFARYLKELVVRSGLTLRVIAEETRSWNPKGVCCRSTLSDMLRHEKVPTAEPVMACLLTVLLAAELDREKDSELVQRRTREALQVWQQLMRPPSGAPVLVAADGEPLLRQALGKLAHAEQAATSLGTADAPGLAHAQRILRELLV